MGKYFALLTNPHSPIAFLDEEWFYTTSRRAKLKCLPLQPGEEKGADRVKIPKMRNRQYPVKSMFLGVVARPRIDLPSMFDGRVFLKRVSETLTLKKDACNANFTHDIHINTLL